MRFGDSFYLKFLQKIKCVSFFFGEGGWCQHVSSTETEGIFGPVGRPCGLHPSQLTSWKICLQLRHLTLPSSLQSLALGKRSQNVDRLQNVNLPSHLQSFYYDGLFVSCISYAA